MPDKTGVVVCYGAVVVVGVVKGEAGLDFAVLTGIGTTDAITTSVPTSILAGNHYATTSFFQSTGYTKSGGAGGDGGAGEFVDLTGNSFVYFGQCMESGRGGARSSGECAGSFSGGSAGGGSEVVDIGKGVHGVGRWAGWGEIASV